MLSSFLNTVKQAVFRASSPEQTKGIHPIFFKYRTFIMATYGVVAVLGLTNYVWVWKPMNRLRTSDIKMDETETTAEVPKLREKLLAQAQGKVLEIAVGSGRNFKYLPTTVTSLSVIDTNEDVAGYLKYKTESLPYEIPVDFRLMAAEHLRWDDNHFDTVVDTFGLCSVSDPVKSLSEMRRVCKGDGKVLLLEHQVVPGKKESPNAFNHKGTHTRDFAKMATHVGLVISGKEEIELTNGIKNVLLICSNPKNAPKEKPIVEQNPPIVVVPKVESTPKAAEVVNNELQK